MNRICIFAAFDAHGIIHDYVLTYLKFLKEISNEIVFISDCSFAHKELAKIEPYVSHYECHKHSEYDFGSYKRGLKYLLSRGNGKITADEVILCNDSCFCINSLLNMFSTMDIRKCDLWAATMSKDPEEHIQSFFLVFKNNVINNNSVLNHFFTVEKKKNFFEVVYSYEIPLLKKLKELGFVVESFIPPKFESNPTMHPIELLKQGLPLVKRKIFIDKRAMKESFFDLGRIIKKLNLSSYRDILHYYGVMFFFQIWLKYYYLVNKKIFMVERFNSGIVRWRFLLIPIFYYKERKPRNKDIEN